MGIVRLTLLLILGVHAPEDYSSCPVCPFVCCSAMWELICRLALGRVSLSCAEVCTLVLFIVYTVDHYMYMYMYM